jgi:hypothetical protein
MGDDRKMFDRNYNDLLEFASDHMPDEWCIELRVVAGEASMELYGPHGIGVDCHPTDGDAVDHWLCHINYARESEGMVSVSWEDYWAAKGGVA